MSWFSPSFSGALVNANALTLMLESFAGKSDSVTAFKLTLPDPCVFLLKSFAFFIAPDGITGFGIVLAEHCNLVSYSFILRIDWLKHFLKDHAMTCGVNGLKSFICLWCNTSIGTIGKERFHHTLLFMTKQRCSSAATSRLHQKLGIIDTSVATPDILTRHRIWCSQTYFWCLGDKSDVDWVVFHISSHFRTKIS